MNKTEALSIIDYYYENGLRLQDEPAYLEALEYLSIKEQDDDAMIELGGYYYDNKDFDSALFWYEEALKVSGGQNQTAISNLGYIWYYGRTGIVDYEKAYYYFNIASKYGYVTATLKLADMYKNGYFVEKNYDIYCQKIEELYDLYLNDNLSNDHAVPDILLRLASIKEKAGLTQEAIILYLRARSCLIVRLVRCPFFGDISLIKSVQKSINRLIELNLTEIDIFDLLAIDNLFENRRFSFKYRNKIYYIDTENDNGKEAIYFEGQWFDTIQDFLLQARIDDSLLLTLFYEIEDFQMLSAGEKNEHTS